MLLLKAIETQEVPRTSQTYRKKSQQIQQLSFSRKPPKQSVGVCHFDVEVNIAFHGPMLELTKKLELLGRTSLCHVVSRKCTPDLMVIDEE